MDCKRSILKVIKDIKEGIKIIQKKQQDIIKKKVNWRGIRVISGSRVTL